LDVRLATTPHKNLHAVNPKENEAGRSKQWQPGKWEKATELRIFMWNVLTLYRPGPLKMLIEQLKEYNVDTTAIQEVRWTGTGVLEKKECTVFYSCSNSKHEFGTGFIVVKKVKHLVINFIPVNKRVSCLHIRGKLFSCSLINVQAPSADKTEDDKEAFYLLLEKTYDACPRNDIKIVLGDMNAQIGKEDVYHPIIWKHSLHNISNVNRQRLISFTASRGMVLGVPYSVIRTYIRYMEEPRWAEDQSDRSRLDRYET
jgi:exonuclease III